MTHPSFATAVPAAKADASPAPVTKADTIRLGGGFRLPAPVQTAVADKGAIRLGGGFRLPATRS